MEKNTDIQSVMIRSLKDLEHKSIKAEKRGEGVAMPEWFKERINKSFKREVFRINQEQ